MTPPRGPRGTESEMRAAWGEEGLRRPSAAGLSTLTSARAPAQMRPSSFQIPMLHRRENVSVYFSACGAVRSRCSGTWLCRKGRRIQRRCAQLCRAGSSATTGACRGDWDLPAQPTDFRHRDAALLPQSPQTSPSPWGGGTAPWLQGWGPAHPSYPSTWQRPGAKGRAAAC